MQRETKSLKAIIKTGVFSGLFFATFMAGFDYLSKDPFSIFKFIFHSLFFGLFMSISFRHNYKKKK